MSYITLKGLWCDIVLNVHAETQDKDNVIKDIFYFPRYHMNILLGDLNAKVGREGGYF
jgi:hypothetical protein